MTDTDSRANQPAGPPVVGIAEAAEMLGMKHDSLAAHRTKEAMARQRGAPVRDPFPEPDWMISGRPTWRPKTILAWGQRTGRIDADGRPRPIKPGPRPRRPPTR
jgi:hypothetical protein